MLPGPGPFIDISQLFRDVMFAARPTFEDILLDRAALYQDPRDQEAHSYSDCRDLKALSMGRAHTCANLVWSLQDEDWALPGSVPDATPCSQFLEFKNNRNEKFRVCWLLIQTKGKHYIVLTNPQNQFIR